MNKLLMGVEECCRVFVPARRPFVWRENGRSFRLESKENNAGRFFLCSVTDVEGKKLRSFFIGVYGPMKRCKRELFWEELGSLKGSWEGPWCIGGDFNMILSPNERNSVGRLSHSMRRFNEVLNELGLRDLRMGAL